MYKLTVKNLEGRSSEELGFRRVFLLLAFFLRELPKPVAPAFSGSGDGSYNSIHILQLFKRVQR